MNDLKGAAAQHKLAADVHSAILATATTLIY